MDEVPIYLSRIRIAPFCPETSPQGNITYSKGDGSTQRRFDLLSKTLGTIPWKHNTKV